MNLSPLRQRVNELQNQSRQSHQIYRQEIDHLEALETLLGHIAEALVIVQTIGQSLQEYSHRQIAQVVTTCLQTVLPEEDYSFLIRFERKRGRTEAKLLLQNHGQIIEDPLEEDSGGVLDVASLALQVAILMLAKPQPRRLLVLDEPFKFVSPEYRDNIRQMIEQLSRECGIQFLIVTHMPELMMGRTIQL